MSLQDYATNVFYDQGQDLRDCHFVLGKDTELWMTELAYGTCSPTAVGITGDFTTNAVAVDDETINIIAASDITLYRGDILKFPSGSFIIATTTAIPATTSTAVPILPSLVAISADEATATYALVPVISVMDGGGLEFSAEEATAQNKIQGLYEAKSVTKRTVSTTITGSLIKTDNGADLLASMTRGSRNGYFQSRYAPFIEMTVGGTTYIEGTGIGAFSFEATVNASFDFNRSDYVGVNATLNVSGRPVPYTVLTA